MLRRQARAPAPAPTFDRVLHSSERNIGRHMLRATYGDAGVARGRRRRTTGLPMNAITSSPPTRAAPLSPLRWRARCRRPSESNPVTFEAPKAHGACSWRRTPASCTAPSRREQSRRRAVIACPRLSGCSSPGDAGDATAESKIEPGEPWGQAASGSGSRVTWWPRRSSWWMRRRR